MSSVRSSSVPLKGRIHTHLEVVRGRLFDDLKPLKEGDHSSEVCSFVGRYVDLIYLGRAGTNIRSRFGATQIRPNNPTKVRLAQQGGFLSYLARGGLHVEPAASVWSGMDALAAAASLSTFRSATDDNALNELARPQGRVAASRVEGHFPADEVLPAHENGHGGGATLSDAEDASVCR